MSEQMIYPEVDAQWLPLVNALAGSIRVADVAWTVNSDSQQWDFGPYVQVCYFPEDNEFLAEITSNAFLRPPMSEYDEHRLRFLGWNPPAGSDYPNWYRIYPMAEESFEHAARLWVRTLLECFGLEPEWRFRVSPMDMALFRQWHETMVNFYGVGSYRLIDAKGRTKAELDQIEARQNELKMRMPEIHAEIRSIIYRAWQLGLYGTELISLASSMASAEVAAEMSRLVYCGVDQTFNYYSSDHMEDVGLFPSVEIEKAQAASFERLDVKPQLSMVAN